VSTYVRALGTSAGRGEGTRGGRTGRRGGGAEGSGAIGTRRADGGEGDDDEEEGVGVVVGGGGCWEFEKFKSGGMIAEAINGGDDGDDVYIVFKCIHT
jgi:hypothetical protein